VLSLLCIPSDLGLPSLFGATFFSVEVLCSAVDLKR